MANDGKFIEKRVGKALSETLGKESMITRLYDTSSSAYFLPPIPADFMGVFKGGTPVVIECKSSDAELTFTDCRLKSYVKPTQYAYSNIWMKMGGVSLFIFYSDPAKTVEYWSADVILNAYKNGWPKTKALPLSTSTALVKDIKVHISNSIDSIKEKL